MRALVVVLVAAAACRRAPSGPTIDVTVLAETDPMVSATVVSYHPDGTEIDLQSTDVSGRVALVVAADALIGVGFVGGNAQQYVSLPAPAAHSELTIVGPPPYRVPTVAGVLTIAPAQTIAADAYVVELGCVTMQVASLPITVDVPSACLGTDTQIAAVVIAYSAGTIVGYASTGGQIAFDTGNATLAPAAWSQPSPIFTVTNDVGAQLAWNVFVDGLAYAGPPGETWDLVTPPAGRLDGTLGSGATIQGSSNLDPHVTAGDFLAPIAPSLTLDDPATLAMHGGACDASEAVTNVRVTWPDNGANVWDVVMPTGPIGFALPPAFGAPPTGTALTVIERCVVSDLQQFALVVGAGIWVDDPVNPSAIAIPRSVGDLHHFTQTTETF